MRFLPGFFIVCTIISCSFTTSAQELFVYSEPASNMPAKSLSVKLSGMFEKGIHTQRIMQRYTPELMLGLSKKWMVHLASTFSDMYQPAFKVESARLYGKWRFLSVDDIHKHFRMAAFGMVSYSRNSLLHNEINLMGDQSGFQLGLIATQLWNKLAVSGTASINEVLKGKRWSDDEPQLFAYEALNYSLSAGYLVLPLNYTGYNQTNLNIYLELIGSRNLDWQYEKYYVDLAPAIQLIFNSNAKLNLGYRFQLSGDIDRMAKRSFMVSYEHTFLNALKGKK